MKVTFHHSLQRGMKKNHLGWWHAERASPTPDFNRFPSCTPKPTFLSLSGSTDAKWWKFQHHCCPNYFSFHNNCQRSSLLPTLQLQEFQISANHYECVSNRFRCQVNLYCICSCWSQRWSSFKAERKGKNGKEGEKIMDVRHATIKKVLWGWYHESSAWMEKIKHYHHQRCAT